MPDKNPPAEPRPQPDTPPSVEAVLSASDLDDLFRDLAACVELQHIAVKKMPGRSDASAIPPDLVGARMLLDQPNAHALQLRYTYNADLWIDTITRRQDDYHLLRVRH